MKWLVIVFLLFTNFCFAQIPTRLIVNPGFEQPSLGCTNCFNLFPDANVAGWNTTDPTAVIEIWGTNFQSKTSHSGNQFAEINANNSAFLYQELCLTPNEVVNYSIWYLKRTASTEQMKAQLTELNNAVISQSVTYTATNTWTNYTGTLTNNGTGGLKRIGFVAVTAGSTGNLIDDITISLKPIISLKTFSPTKEFEGTGTNLVLVVNGTLTSSATITLTKSGTASYLSDFTVGTPTRGSLSISNSDIILTLPAGDYNPNLNAGTTMGEISIPITTISDGISELSEYLTYSIGTVSGGGTTYPLVAGLNGYGATCSTYLGSVTDTILNYSPLPIELIYFKGILKDEKVILSWRTATETNNDYFTITSSNDLVELKEITKISGAGTSNFPHDYIYIDSEVKKYYRLCQIDYDGQFECFDWISIPNLTLQDKFYKFFDLYGREVREMNKNGVYFMIDESGKSSRILKF